MESAPPPPFLPPPPPHLPPTAYAVSAPAGWGTPVPARPAARTQRRGVAGSVLAALAAAAKYGVVLVKLGKFGPTLISMALSFFVLLWLYGPVFGAGALALVAVHEFGHVAFAKREGLPVTMPLFLGPFGALISPKRPFRDARQEAVIAIGGPVVGSLGALALALWALSLPAGHNRSVVMALAYFGFFLNLFNLTPALPLDGGRVAGAVSVWFNVAGLALIAAIEVGLITHGVPLNPILVLLLIAGAFTTVRRFRTRRGNPYFLSVPVRTRLILGLSWAGLVAATGVGMSLAHRSLVDNGVLTVSAASGDYRSAVDDGAARLDAAEASLPAACGVPGSVCAQAAATAAAQARDWLGSLPDAPSAIATTDGSLRVAVFTEALALDDLSLAATRGDSAAAGDAISRLAAAGRERAAATAGVDATGG